MMRWCLLASLVLLAATVSATAHNDLAEAEFAAAIKEKPALVEFYAPWCGHCKKLIPEWTMLAEAAKKSGDVVVATVDADREKGLAGQYEVSGFPTIKYFPAGSLTPGLYAGGRTAKDLATFLNDKTGSSLEIKEPPTFAKALTDASFDDLVLDPNKDVMVEFYAPWCGHCKHLAPVYEEVAQIYKGEPNIEIVKIDAAAYKVKATEYGVGGYPTLKWFPKGENKEPEDYTGGRDAESFVQFLNEQTGAQRVVGGGFSPEAGRSEDLDELIATFMASSDRAAVLADIEAAVENHSNELAKFYRINAKRVADRGETFLTTESSRLSRMLEGGMVKSNKVAQFHKRLNILNVFLDAAPAAAGKEDL